MKTRSGRRLAAALLAATMAVAALPGVGGAEDERPDLKIDHVGLFVGKDGQVNDRVVTFKVTNVGNRDASEGSGKLEVVSPPPKWEEPLKIDKVVAKNGGSYQGLVQLPAPCDGHEVRVSVQAPGESRLGNNTVGPLKLCQAKPKPAPKPDGGPVLETEVDADVLGRSGPETKIDTDVIRLPEHMRPGEHDRSLAPSIVYPWFRGRHLSNEGERTACEPVDAPPRRVGWLQSEQKQTGPFGIEISRCAYVAEGQVGVNFDYGVLDDVRNAQIIRAELTFDERAVAWFDTDGSFRQVAGCVAAVGIATAELEAHGNTDELLPFEPYRDVTPNSSRRFDVRSAVQQHVWNERPRFGFVLRGSLSLGQLEAEGSSSCMSSIENIRLQVHYVVPS